MDDRERKKKLDVKGKLKRQEYRPRDFSLADMRVPNQKVTQNSRDAPMSRWRSNAYNTFLSSVKPQRGDVARDTPLYARPEIQTFKRSRTTDWRSQDEKIIDDQRTRSKSTHGPMNPQPKLTKGKTVYQGGLLVIFLLVFIGGSLVYNRLKSS